MTPPFDHEIDQPDGGHALSAAVPTSPEDRLVFRLAQLTVLLEVMGEETIAVQTVDRLGLPPTPPTHATIVVHMGRSPAPYDGNTHQITSFYCIGRYNV